MTGPKLDEVLTETERTYSDFCGRSHYVRLHMMTELNSLDERFVSLCGNPLARSIWAEFIGMCLAQTMAEDSVADSHARNTLAAIRKLVA